MVYDEESGLVYNETVRKPCDCFRQHLYRTRSIRLASGLSKALGSKKLVDVVTTRILRNLDGLEPQALLELPASLTEGLWNVIEKRGLDSFPVWTVFANARATCLRGKTFQWVYHCASCRRLPDVLRLANNASCKWLTDLSLDCQYVTGGDLFLLPSLTNVRTLHIRASRDCMVTDRVLRRWADAAKGEGAFGHLMTIEIVYCPRGYEYNDLTQFSLDRLQYFPTLKQVDLFDASRYITKDTQAGDRFGCFVRQPEEQFVQPMPVKLEMPSLRVNIGRNPSGILRQTKTVRLIRDETVKLPALSGDVDKGGVRNVAKKRKVRHGKAMALDGFLQKGK